MHTYKKRILCADDDMDSCEMMTVLLGLLGYEVISVQNCASAIGLAGSESFDLFLLDNRLPDGSGIELCKWLRSSCPSTPVVFYSGASQESDKREAMGAGAQAYLVKPTDIVVIEQTISRLISGGGGVKEYKPPPVPELGSRTAHNAPRLRMEEISWTAWRATRRVELPRSPSDETKDRISFSGLKADRTADKNGVNS